MKNYIIPRVLSLSLLLYLSIYSMNAQTSCPTEDCTTHTIEISASSLPECGVSTTTFGGDIDNNSDCDEGGSGTNNCHKFVFDQNGTTDDGVTMDIGKGNNCNGEVNVFYSLIDGVCTNEGSSGSQNTFSFIYGADGLITLYLCDGSSGQSSVCELCAESLGSLPVALESWTALATSKGNILSWSTSIEHNTEDFVIERSADGVENWTDIIHVDAQGFSSVTQNYSHMDRDPLEMGYYRLRTRDYDGRHDISDIISARRSRDYSEDNELLLYPNPLKTNDHLTVAGMPLKSVSILDMNGKKLRSFEFEEELSAFTIDNKELALLDSGIYFIQVNKSTMKKWLKF